MKRVLRKIEQLRAGRAPNVLDLFSGCGGISLGLQFVGCRLVAGLDIDRGAMENWYYNLRPDLMCRLNAVPAWDITATVPDQVFTDLGESAEAGRIDIICGGPPCQAYSRIGRGKLQSLGGTDAHLLDERGLLYWEFLRYVSDIQPVAVICENVADSTNYGGENIPEDICSGLARIGYRTIWTVLNAADYGVPQYRYRVFILAIHQAAGVRPVPPAPSHRIVRQPELKAVREGSDVLFENATEGKNPHYVRPPAARDDLPRAVVVGEALSDLPVMTPLALPKRSKICQDVKTLMAYSAAQPTTSYQRLMRSWPGFETGGWVTGNTIRDTPRDFPIFARMAEGDLYPDAVRIANQLLTEKIAAAERDAGRPLAMAERERLRKSTVPPYDETKFLGKWTKLRRDQPSHTVVAHLQYDTYSHIHYDSGQARAISVREAARLQSFPDGFRFLGSMRSSFEQIGNAVPPLMAAAIGRTMLGLLIGKQVDLLDTCSAPTPRDMTSAPIG